MDSHRLILFGHIMAMTGLIAALALEGTTLWFLKRATSYEQAREWIAVWNLLPAVGAPSLLASLGSGLYLATSLGTWGLAWVQIAVPTLVVVAIAGGVTAPRRNQLRATIGTTDTGRLPDDLKMLIRRPFVSASWCLRAALLIGLAFEMTMKPERGVLIMAGFALAGIVWGFRLGATALDGLNRSGA